MSRPVIVKDAICVSVRIESELYEMIKEIAALETLSTGRIITTNALIRDALRYVYEDNERMRESFRRSRASQSERYKKYCL
jgi:predicted DNA-binding ribbon-helix-helix protein